MLVDDVKIKIKAGDGGKGAQTFKGFRKGVKVGADGGDGGRGGNIYFKADQNVSDLSIFQFKKEVKSEDGSKGLSKNKNGKDAKDEIILVPVGTKIIDEKYNKEYELIDDERILLLAKGGEGELGSYSLSKGIEQTIKNKGQEKPLHLTLSLIADIGLIGLPNAGKSSLLSALTNANPKIGDYPFTTVEPNLGTINRLIIADIPGLIEGASVGHGLGIKFLRHIEKTKVLFHCISAADPNPDQSYKIVRAELEKFNKELIEKEEIIILTKKDLVSTDDLKLKMNKFKNKTVIPVSIQDKKSLDKLIDIILKI